MGGEQARAVLAGAGAERLGERGGLDLAVDLRDRVEVVGACERAQQSGAVGRGPATAQRALDHPAKRVWVERRAARRKPLHAVREREAAARKGRVRLPDRKQLADHAARSSLTIELGTVRPASSGSRRAR